MHVVEAPGVRRIATHTRGAVVRRARRRVGFRGTAYVAAVALVAPHLVEPGVRRLTRRALVGAVVERRRRSCAACELPLRLGGHEEILVEARGETHLADELVVPYRVVQNSARVCRKLLLAVPRIVCRRLVAPRAGVAVGNEIRCRLLLAELPLPVRHLENADVEILGESGAVRMLARRIEPDRVRRIAHLELHVLRRYLAHQEKMLAVVVRVYAARQLVRTLVETPLAGIEVADHVGGRVVRRVRLDRDAHGIDGGVVPRHIGIEEHPPVGALRHCLERLAGKCRHVRRRQVHPLARAAGGRIRGYIEHHHRVGVGQVVHYRHLPGVAVLRKPDVGDLGQSRRHGGEGDCGRKKRKSVFHVSSPFLTLWYSTT